MNGESLKLVIKIYKKESTISNLDIIIPNKN